LTNTHNLTVLQSLTLIAILRKAVYGFRGDPAFGNCCEMSQKAVPLTKPFWFMTLAGLGRFQDTDEAAHNEFVCKSAGIPVHYCAETFGNDGSLPSSIMKALKRAMAGEYSRELSVKVFAGQKRPASTQKAVSPSVALLW
jgi:hypothetical protein